MTIYKNPRIRILLHSVAFLVLAAIFLFVLESQIVAAILGAAALFFLVISLFIPAATEVLDNVSRAVARGVATLLTWALLVPFFYLCFVPGRIAQLVSRRDPLARAFPTDEESYWIDYREVTDMDEYKRQF